MDEGVVEGGEDAGDAEDELACESRSQYVVVYGEIVRMGRPSLTCGPREMFSCAVRSTFFFGAMVLL